MTSIKTTAGPRSVRYVAFLRGINMIGHKVVPMAVLTKLFGSLGLENVQTHAATGNVLFESDESDPNELATRIEL